VRIQYKILQTDLTMLVMLPLPPLRNTLLVKLKDIHFSALVQAAERIRLLSRGSIDQSETLFNVSKFS